MTELITHADASAADVASADLRVAYAAPDLRLLGDLRDLTLGASSGAIESGSTRTFRR